MNAFFTQHTRQRLFKVCVLSLLFLLIGLVHQIQLSAFTSQEQDALRRAKQVHLKGKYPRDLPRGIAKKKPEQPQPNEGCASKNLPKGPNAGFLCQSVPWLLWGIVLFLLMIVVWSAIRNIPRQKEEESVESQPIIMGRVIEKHMRLEDFLEVEDWEGAMCWLLLESMKRLGWRSEGAGQSQTAREVFASVPKEASFEPILAQLLRWIEEVRFAGKEATHERYEQAYEAFVQFRELHTHSVSENTPEVMGVPLEQS